MSSCEKCWDDSNLEAALSNSSQSEIYRRLVTENNCTPAQQAGSARTQCGKCLRITAHQYTGQCMACGFNNKRGTVMNIDAAVKRACQEPTLAEALSWIAVWENDRAMRYVIEEVKKGSGDYQWDTCFLVCFERILKEYQ